MCVYIYIYIYILVIGEKTNSTLPTSSSPLHRSTMKCKLVEDIKHDSQIQHKWKNMKKQKKQQQQLHRSTMKRKLVEDIKHDFQIQHKWKNMQKQKKQQQQQQTKNTKHMSSLDVVDEEKMVDASVFERLEAALAAIQLPVVEPNDRAGYQASLDQYGCAIVALDADSLDAVTALRCTEGSYLADTFASIPASVKTHLRQGDFTTFNQFWKKSPVKMSRIMLRSFGAPQPLPIRKQHIGLFKDKITGGIYTFNPLAAQGSMSVWEKIPGLMSLLPDDVYVASDGCKPMAGQTITGMHSDNSNQSGRIQIVFIQDAANAKRHLKVVPSTPAVCSIISEIVGKQIRPGFAALDHPALLPILSKHGVGLPDGVSGLLCFAEGTQHYEVLVNTNKSPGETFRVYCGYQPVRGVADEETLIRMGALRQEGYALSPYCNKKNPLHQNEKSTQYHNVKIEQADENLTRLMAMSTDDLKSVLRARCTPTRLRLLGLGFLVHQ
jgi:hypothetical protein